jgi:hypothetical protein
VSFTCCFNRVHETPLPLQEAKAKVAAECKCKLDRVVMFDCGRNRRILDNVGTRYCWGDATAPWLKNLPNIRQIIRSAITAYLSEYTAIYARENTRGLYTTVDPSTDITNAPNNGDGLPLIPGSVNSVALICCGG